MSARFGAGIETPPINLPAIATDPGTLQSIEGCQSVPVGDIAFLARNLGPRTEFDVHGAALCGRFLFVRKNPPLRAEL